MIYLYIYTDGRYMFTEINNILDMYLKNTKILHYVPEYPIPKATNFSSNNFNKYKYPRN